MDEILFEVLKCVVIVVCLLITRYVIPYLKQTIEKQQNEVLNVLVQIAVQYAEQCYDTGKEKKEIVTSLAVSNYCPFGAVDVYECDKDGCENCVKNRIEWEIKDGEQE